ncbi:MAG: alpha-D-ribose 1-methylphosphonate 5-triphosphate diphosphatase, partial [Phycisphaerales bacterium]|nr:alpha-D-ribose 1-methylphosphonate 5-triphosphate diphosphatase [Phycisphaerales bacterium]
AEITEGDTPPRQTSGGVREIDARGCILMPGLVDLHCDAIEGQAEPRPGVLLPFDLAIRAMDTRLAAAGITTCFHAITFAGKLLGLRDIETATRLADSIAEFGCEGSIDHRVHARIELTAPDAPSAAESLLSRGRCSMLSLMDHTPGQGQFRTIESLIDYLTRSYAMDEAEVLAVIDEHERVGARNLLRIVRLARGAIESGIPVASHDDDSVERIGVGLRLGVSICEFPMNNAVAAEATRAGLACVVGAPNVVRGGSHGAGPSAETLLREGDANCLSSDYAPETLLPAVFRLAESMPLHEAIALATANPASATGLSDRGSIRDGARADLLLVDTSNPRGIPIASDVWIEGICVLRRLARSSG